MKIISTIVGNAISLLYPIPLRNKLSSLKTIICLSSYDRYMKKKCKKYGENNRIYFPKKMSGLEYISIGNNFKLDDNSRIEAIDNHNNIKFKPSIVIGDNVSFGYNTHIGAINKIEIGSNVLGGANILIIDHNHGNSDYLSIKTSPNERKLYSSGEIKIGSNCWIGDKVTILPDVTIGDNCIIGANSVVTHSVPNNCVIAGNPSKVIKKIEEEK